MRFEVQQTGSLEADKAIWTSIQAVGSVVNGNYVFEDRTASEEPSRYYRVLRKVGAAQNP